ncbi:MAG TPA: ABC transporter substrate-binding protein [Nocardioides sp.]|uniref:ABC transporter substrate-binding protein n=1 Tax=Nocardioides sp. TaxID=35761 RepID=UPI002ED7A7D0
MRTFRLTFTAAVAAFTLLGSAACSESTSKPSSKLDFDDLRTTTPVGSGDAGTIKWNLPYEPLSLDPIKSFNYSENTALANACESLLRAEPDFTVGPGLAESWENPDPTTWVYTIREGVTFWDGKPLTAEDVAWSIGRNLDPENGGYLGKYFVNVDSINATGPRTVTIKLKQPDALLQQALAALGGIVVQKAATIEAGKEFGTPEHLPMCTGPFQLASWAPGQRLSFTRNESYWDPKLKAKSSGLELSFVADESTSVLALSSGQLDGQFFYLPPAGLEKLQSSKEGDVVMGDSQIYWTLIGSATSGPYADPRIRKALSMAVDRASLAAATFQGAAIPAKTLAPPASWTYAKDTFSSAYDQVESTDNQFTEAKELVKEAGSPQQPITLAVQGSSAVHEQTGNLIQAAGQAIGLTVKIRSIPVEQYGNVYVDPGARKGIDAFLSTYYGVPDPLDAYTMFVKGDYSNFTDYADVSDQVAAARNDIDPESRATTVTEIQTKVLEDAVWTPLEFLPVILFQSDRITGATASSNYLYYPWAAGIGTKG